MAVQGLEVYNADGTIRSSVTDNFNRIVGSTTVSGYGTIPWPYPSLIGRRSVQTVSNGSLSSDGTVSTAFAYIYTDGLIYYDQGDDTKPITILFMVY